MKKPLREGITGFRTGTGKINILVMFFMLSFDVFPQVPVNGFCRYQEFNTEPGFKNFFPVNYNGDSYTDLLLFNPFDKKICSLDGSQNGSFGKAHIYSIEQQFSDIQYLRDRNQNIIGYAFISRKQNAAGIMKINNEGLPEIESLIRFNTYPENLSTADINDDGKPELLISGSTFNGLSIVYGDKKLSEIKFAEKTSYPEAVFVDLNNDGYPDIAGYEIFTNMLQFFYNNSKSDFKKVREIPLNNPVSQLQAADIDIDSYSDLILSGNSGIKIYYGDFTSSYKDTLDIITKYNVDKFVTGDFNRDGKIDIAYLNNEGGILSVIFAKDSRTFYPELVYLKKDSLSDIIPYYSKFVNGISLLNKEGKIYLISNLTSFSDSVNIVSGGFPTAISYFDKDNNGINDLCFIDGFNKTLNLIIRSNSGIPEIWFPLPLFEEETDIIVNNENPQFKTFYCYTRDKKLIEVLNVDLKKNKFSRNSLYTKGKIKDIKLKKEKGRLYAAFLKDSSLGVTEFSGESGKYSEQTINDIHKNVLDAALSVYENPEVYYAASENDSLIIGEKFLQVNKKSSEIHPGLRSIYNVLLYAGNFLSKSGSALYGFLTTDVKNNLTFFISRDTMVMRGKGSIPGFRIKEKNQLFFGKMRSNESRKVFIYNDDLHTVNSLYVSSGERKISTDIISDDINARSFFIKNMNSQDYHIVYIDKSENCITIKKIK
jgi:hypothetical protein